MTDTKNKTNFCPEFELTNSEQEVARAHNSGFKKLAVQWLNEVLCFVSSSVLADSFVLRNRQLLVTAKRYKQAMNKQPNQIKNK